VVVSKNLIYINGDYVSEDKAGLSPFNRGLLYGDGIFETMRSYSGRVFAVKEHFARLEKSADFMNLNIPFDAEGIELILTELMECNSLLGKDSRIRVNLMRGEGKRGLFADVDADSEIIISAEEVPAGMGKIQKDGVGLVVITDFRIDNSSVLSQHKTFNYIPGILGLMEVRRRGGDEGLFLNNDGCVAEGVTSNIFVVKNGVVMTPPLSAGVLPGITRGLAIQLVREEGIKLKECDVSLEELTCSDEIFITSSVREVVPVISVDNKGFEPGPVTRRIQEIYREYVERWRRGTE
jgi:branched-chain amino acid aminotransferase